MIRLFLLCMFFALPAAAQTVSTPAQLRVALQQAQVGSVITLQAGNYGALNWQGGRGVTLRGEGSFTGLALRDVRDITLSGLQFTYASPRGAADHARPFEVTGSVGVTFEDVRFVGGATGYGLHIEYSRDVILQGAYVQGFQRGFVAKESANIAILDTEFTGQRSDGMNFAAVQGVTVARNTIHDFARDASNGDHADMIQFWTRGTDQPSTDIQIIGNVLNAGAGLWTQSIFMRNEAYEAGQTDMAYRDVTISGNMIINAHLHGITVGETDGLTIRRNTVVQNPRAAGPQDNRDLWVPQITVAARARNVDVTGNIVAGITGAAGGADNLIVQNHNPADANYYGAVFGAKALTHPQDPRSYLSPRPDMGAVATPAWR